MLCIIKFVWLLSRLLLIFLIFWWWGWWWQWRWSFRPHIPQTQFNRNCSKQPSGKSKDCISAQSSKAWFDNESIVHSHGFGFHPSTMRCWICGLRFMTMTSTLTKAVWFRDTSAPHLPQRSTARPCWPLQATVGPTYSFPSGMAERQARGNLQPQHFTNTFWPARVPLEMHRVTSPSPTFDDIQRCS